MQKVLFALLFIVGVFIILLVFKQCYGVQFEGGKAYSIESSEGDYSPDKALNSESKIGPTIKDTYNNQAINRFEYWHQKPSKTEDVIYDLNAQVVEINLNLKNKQLVKGRGYFHETEIRIPATKNGREGLAIIKPFQFVREKSTSVGGPVWFVFDAVLVNIGWLPVGINKHPFMKKSFTDLLDNPLKIRGHNIQFKEDNLSVVIGEENYKMEDLWEIVHQQIDIQNLRPVGGRKINGFIELIQPTNE